jgi:hypothetical protein
LFFHATSLDAVDFSKQVQQGVMQGRQSIAREGIDQPQHPSHVGMSGMALCLWYEHLVVGLHNGLVPLHAIPELRLGDVEIPTMAESHQFLAPSFFLPNYRSQEGCSHVKGQCCVLRYLLGAVEV